MSIPLDSLVDSFGRKITYLRFSVTERCNLRCRYCMPQNSPMTQDETFSFDDMLRICRIVAGMGIGAIRLTGGEPLVRPNLASLVARMKRIDGLRWVTITTNGILLPAQLQSLADSGLDALNISLDTVNEDTFQHLTGGKGLDAILASIDKAYELGLTVKVNCVPLRNANEDDLVKIVLLAKDKNIAIRFIELMPFGAASAMQGLSVDEVSALIEEAYGPLEVSPEKPGNGPAVYHRLEGFTGLIGIIGALSQSYCKGCNRLRITASGMLKPCLASNLGLDLHALMQGGASDTEIEAAVRKLVAEKPAGHNFTAADEREQYQKTELFRIGG